MALLLMARESGRALCPTPSSSRPAKTIIESLREIAGIPFDKILPPGALNGPNREELMNC